MLPITCEEFLLDSDSISNDALHHVEMYLIFEGLDSKYAKLVCMPSSWLNELFWEDQAQHWAWSPQDRCEWTREKDASGRKKKIQRLCQQLYIGSMTTLKQAKMMVWCPANYRLVRLCYPSLPNGWPAVLRIYGFGSIVKLRIATRLVWASIMVEWA